jgi:gluconate 2-dehydrogenase alpha chain
VTNSESLAPGERAALGALLERMFPADARGPGASAIGAADYIVAALAGAYAAHLPDYRAVLAALDAAARETSNAAFAESPAEQQDQIIAAWESGKLDQPDAPLCRHFERIWRHLREGLFCDPEHDGNRDLAGWRLIGFPGAQHGYEAAEQALDANVLREPLARARRREPRRAPATLIGSAPAEGTDVCIVGAGLAGMAAAWVFAEAGLSVLVLEAGPARTGKERVLDELAGTSVRNDGGAAKYNHEAPTWRRNAAESAQKLAFPQGLENGLGGNTVPWGAVAHRFHAGDFRARSETVERYGAQTLPGDSLLCDWSVDYDAMEPWYAIAERVLGVSGQEGNLQGRAIAGGNPFDAPRRDPYPMPALRTSGLGALFGQAAAAAGLHPFPLPAAIATQELRERGACTYCSFCSRFGCHVDAKASVQNTLLGRALATGRVAIRADSEVTRVATDDRGRAIGVDVRTADGRTTFQPAGRVVLAAYTFEVVRLMRLSAGAQHPDGLGNRTGMLGVGYMTRQQPSVYAHFPGRRLNRFIGPTAQAMAVDDFNADHFDHTGLGFLRGGRIACFNQYLPIEASGILPPGVPRWGAAWRDWVLAAYHATAMLFIDPEILPYRANRLDLDPNHAARDGRPLLRITFDIGDNERRMIAFLQERARMIAERMGAARIWARPPLTGPISTHDVGGARMGRDPATSVTDDCGRVHDTPNLMVLGGALFPTLPGLNPALTILALALRAAAGVAGLEATAVASAARR